MPKAFERRAALLPEQYLFNNFLSQQRRAQQNLGTAWLFPLKDCIQLTPYVRALLRQNMLLNSIHNRELLPIAKPPNALRMLLQNMCMNSIRNHELLPIETTPNALLLF